MVCLVPIVEDMYEFDRGYCEIWFRLVKGDVVESEERYGRSRSRSLAVTISH